MQGVEIHFQGREEFGIYLSQYDDYWQFGDTRSQGISRFDFCRE